MHLAEIIFEIEKELRNIFKTVHDPQQVLKKTLEIRHEKTQDLVDHLNKLEFIDDKEEYLKVGELQIGNSVSALVSSLLDAFFHKIIHSKIQRIENLVFGCFKNFSSQRWN